MIITQDGPKWTARSDDKLGGGLGEGQEGGRWQTLLTPLNGRPGACQGVGRKGG